MKSKTSIMNLQKTHNDITHKHPLNSRHKRLARYLLSNAEFFKNSIQIPPLSLSASPQSLRKRLNYKRNQNLEEICSTRKKNDERRIINSLRLSLRSEASLFREKKFIHKFSETSALLGLWMDAMRRAAVLHVCWPYNLSLPFNGALIIMVIS